ncbi:hypothetical protein [Microbacterium sp. NC79]|uniref:hypothetical protein n=1 Tax=Microbacterium sp. NC79 TaxID=2851009 RepID=UPI001C2C52B4|nr:hypothetical protein [Microbacterium sp. NC79]MBV0895954.1 hypothetical protein [Microbacterium sp. NC79]
MMLASKRLSAVGAVFIGVLWLSACAGQATQAPTEPTNSAAEGAAEAQAAEPAGSAEGSRDAEDADATVQAEETEAATPEVRTQEKSCGWDAPRLDSGVPATLPADAAGDLATALIGSWQHTHFDSGAGFEIVDTADVRFVFPSATEMLYCQDVPGVTDQRQAEAAVTLDGTTIALPPPATGYRAIAWDESAMLWENLRDGSTFLLQRR